MKIRVSTLPREVAFTFSFPLVSKTVNILLASKKVLKAASIRKKDNL